MSSFLVESALETIQKLTAGLSQEEKLELISRLPSTLEVAEKSVDSSSGSQQQRNSVNHVSQTGGNNAFNFAPVQAGRDASSSQNLVQASSQSQNDDLDNALSVLKQLRESIDITNDLTGIQKTGAKAEVDKLAEELQKNEPNQGLVQRTINTLKQGLEGVLTLAKPVQEVATLIGEALAMTII